MYKAPSRGCSSGNFSSQSDVEDATATPKVIKPGFTKDVSQEELLSQASWIDFGDVANWSEQRPLLQGNWPLQEGSTYTKEIRSRLCRDGSREVSETI